MYTIHAYIHYQRLLELLPPIHWGSSVAKPGSSCASISMESCKKTCNHFFVCHQINGVFVNNDDLNLIWLQLSRGSIYQSPGRTTGPRDWGEWRHSWERFLLTAFSKESRTDCFIFIFCLVWPGQARAGEVRPEVSKLYDGFLVFLLRHNGQHAGDPVIARVPQWWHQ